MKRFVLSRENLVEAMEAILVWFGHDSVVIDRAPEEEEIQSTYVQIPRIALNISVREGSVPDKTTPFLNIFGQEAPYNGLRIDLGDELVLTKSHIMAYSGEYFIGQVWKTDGDRICAPAPERT